MSVLVSHNNYTIFSTRRDAGKNNLWIFQVKKSHSCFSSLPPLPTKYSWVYKDDQHQGDQTIDEEVEVSQIHLWRIYQGFQSYSKYLPWHKWSSDEMMLGQFPEFKYFMNLWDSGLLSLKTYHMWFVGRSLCNVNEMRKVMIQSSDVQIGPQLHQRLHQVVVCAGGFIADLVQI